jgi:DNA invertase Pin-like site-specific DNA recombinase
VSGRDGSVWLAQEAEGAGATQIYSEKVSGAVTERKAPARAIAALGPSDVLLVTRLDRLARSTRDLLNVLDAVVKAGAGFKSLNDQWADTTTAHGRLMLTVLGGLAEFERELIRARTDEGRKRAQARGVRFGRKPKLTVHQRQEALARRAAGEALVEIARSNVGLDRTWRLRLLLFLGLEWRRGDYQECAQGSPKHGGAPMTVISAGITAGIRHGSNAGRFSISSNPLYCQDCFGS